MMRIVFMGTPELASNILERLDARHDVVAAFTRRDAVRGRGKKLVASAVKEVAATLGIPVYTPASFSDPETVALVRELNPDAVCVAAFGQLLPPELLEIPRYGCLNVHTSLLPRWRGAAPIERAILAGDEKTGVCIMRMEEGLDTGPYCERRIVDVAGANAEELSRKLSDAGAEALLDVLDRLDEGGVEWTEQGDDGLTYALKVAKGELDLDPAEDASTFLAKVRASSASHPARARIAGRDATVLEAASPLGDALGVPACGQVSYSGKRFLLGTAEGGVELLRVKPAGKKEMDAVSFASGIQGLKKSNVEWGRL